MEMLRHNGSITFEGTGGCDEHDEAAQIGVDNFDELFNDEMRILRERSASIQRQVVGDGGGGGDDVEMQDVSGGGIERDESAEVARRASSALMRDDQSLHEAHMTGADARKNNRLTLDGQFDGEYEVPIDIFFNDGFEPEAQTQEPTPAADQAAAAPRSSIELVPLTDSQIRDELAATARPRRRRRPRDLIVDEICTLDDEIVRGWLQDDSDTRAELQLAPPTKRLMLARERADVATLFSTPATTLGINLEHLKVRNKSRFRYLLQQLAHVRFSALHSTPRAACS